jgi:protein involved in polysaccharide export with SLBB domain
MTIARSVRTRPLFYLLVALMGCSGIKLDPAQVNVGQGLAIPYQIRPGDTLDVRFKYHPADDTQVMVDTSGRLYMPITGELSVQDLTLPQLEELIREKSSRFLRDPVVSVTVSESQARAYIGGEVVDEGFVTLMRPTTVLQAVMERGGFTTGADLGKVVVLSHQAGRPVARELNLKTELEGDPSSRTLLVADEIVFVPKTGIAKANQWMDQYVNKMTPEFLTRMIRFTPIDP